MNQIQPEPALSGMVAMWGVPDQPCCHGNAMVSQTTFEMSGVDALTRDFVPLVMACDTDNTAQIDPRVLGDFQPAVMLERAKTALQAVADLSLSGNLDTEAVHKKADLLKALHAGRKPELAEQVAQAVSAVCQEAGQRLRRTFDAAVDGAPSKVDAVLDDLVKALDQMAVVDLGDAQAIARFIRRAEQIDGLPRWRQELPETTFKSLERQLLQIAQTEYNLAFDRIVAEIFRRAWQDQRDAFKARIDHYREDAQTFRAKINLCAEESDRACQRARQRAAALRCGNQVLLGEVSDDQLRAALMAHRKSGSQVELLEGLRHDLEEGLRERALGRGLGPEIHQAPFRQLVLALPVDEIVGVFRNLLLAGISGTYSLYEACQAYGLERLVSELVRRSQITSWFDGRDDPRFGINRFDFRVVRLPAAANPKDVEIKMIIENLFRQAGFHEIRTSGHSRNISVLRIYAGWPLGIEGGNGVLLQAYGRSARTGHLPHLVGVLPDSQAGKHAPGILNLLDAMEKGEKSESGTP
jgi:hypothetical protein